MKIQGTHTVPGTRERVYDLLLDSATLAACIPGCQELVRVEDGVYKMKMKVALAAVSGEFTGTVKISDAVRPERFRMGIEGSGRIGHLNGEGLLNLIEKDSSTEVAY